MNASSRRPQERLSLWADGQVVYRLRRPWPRAGGVTELVLTPPEFLRRLAALVPARYSHLVRYHGVLANRSADRSLLPPPPAQHRARLQLRDLASPGRAYSNVCSSSTP